MSDDVTPDVKCVVVGNPGVGKTSLIVSWTTGLFPYQNIPPVISKYSANVEVESRTLSMCVWDTASGTEHDEMRPLAYSGANVIIICFSTVDVDTYYAVASKWWPEVYYKAYGVPLILVGTKTDVRMNISFEQPHIDYEQGRKLAEDIGAVQYVECSALTHDNRNLVFETAAGTVVSAGEATVDYDSDSDCCGCTIL